jgi:hypothetical protein
LALIGAILIFGPSVFVLILGEDKFGNGWAFGLTLILFLVMLEKPGFMWRREIVLGEASPDTFDQFLFGVLTVISMTAPIVLLGVHIHSAVLLGVVWGVALVGAQDLARSGIAFFLALAGGLPIYRP